MDINFMNMEVMWPSSANVIDYDVATLVFHGALIYDDSGTVKGEVKGSARILAGMIKQVNKHIGKKYSTRNVLFDGQVHLDNNIPDILDSIKNKIPSYKEYDNARIHLLSKKGDDIPEEIMGNNFEAIKNLGFKYGPMYELTLVISLKDNRSPYIIRIENALREMTDDDFSYEERRRGEEDHEYARNPDGTDSDEAKLFDAEYMRRYGDWLEERCSPASMSKN